MTKQEEQGNYRASRKVGPVQETGITSCWPAYRESKLQGGKKKTQTNQVKKNSLEQSSNVTEHREAPGSPTALYGADSRSKKGAGEDRLALV